MEEAPLTFPNQDSPLLQYPNHINPKDFDGWVQERGLYFATQWDPRYQTVLSSHDPGEKPLEGGRDLDALRQGRLHFHGVFVVPATSGGRAGGVPPVRESAEREVRERSNSPEGGFPGAYRISRSLNLGMTGDSPPRVSGEGSAGMKMRLWNARYVMGIS